MATVMITGANRGLGLEFARQYAAEGANVIACCRNPDKAGALKATGGNVTIKQLDVADSASVDRLAAEMAGTTVDILINNAGVYGPEAQEAGDSDYEGYIDTFRVNSVAPLRVADAFKVNLLKGKDKKFVVLTSKMGSISDSSGGSLAYRASKAALNMIMHGVAKAWAPDGIAVCILHPGWVQTDMGGPNALITPQRSVEGMRAQIAALALKTSGQFVDYKGRAIGW